MRIFFLRFVNERANIKFAGTPALDRLADFEIGNNSHLVIGTGFSMRKNSVVAVRDNATLSIGNGVFINRNTIITAVKNIIIGNRVTIGPNVCIYDHDHKIQFLNHGLINANGGGYVTDNVVIMDNVWIGANVTILKGVIIGENSVIASGCIVTKNVKANTILIQKRDNTEIKHS